MPAHSSHNQKNSVRKVFISWSGDNSKAIALKLKEALENHIFKGSGLQCFVSDVSLKAGEEWYARIKRELNACKIGIAVITKENISAPWLYFEAGAIVAKEKDLIPLLFNCGHKSLENTPLGQRQQKIFYEPKDFKSVICQINEKFGGLQPNEDALDDLINKGYDWLKKEIAPISKRLKDMRVFNLMYVYPSHISTVIKDSVYVTAPMASFTKKEDYNKMRDFILSIENELVQFGFVEVKSPLKDNAWDDFEGPAAAIEKNYPDLKATESILVILPKNDSYSKVSSIWLDIGYCLALTKKIVIFHEDELPYMLEAAGSYINHVHTYKPKDPSEDFYDFIRKTLTSSKKALFGTTGLQEKLE